MCQIEIGLLVASIEVGKVLPTWIRSVLYMFS
jgi:hypothetical protein